MLGVMDTYKKRVIQQVKIHPLLWDPTHKDYKSKEHRQEVWQEIDNVLQPPRGFGLNAKSTWDKLTRSLSNALRRQERQAGKGACSSQIKEWRFQQDLNFLLPVKKNRLSLLTGYNLFFPAQSEAGDSFDGDAQEEEEDDEDEEEEGEEEEEQEEGRETLDQTQRNFGWEGKKIPSENEEIENKMQSERQTYDYSSSSCSKRRKIADGYLAQGDSARDEDEELVKFLNVFRQRHLEKSTSESIRLHFFRSIMPQVDALSDDGFLEFQIEVIQSLQKRRILSKIHAADHASPK